MSQYKSGTTLEMVWRLYSFDRRMRLVAADALARIEIALRTLIVEMQTAAQKGAPFAYANAAALPKFSPPRCPTFGHASVRASRAGTQRSLLRSRSAHGC